MSEKWASTAQGLMMASLFFSLLISFLSFRQPFLFFNSITIRYGCVVFDEVHTIRNMGTTMYKTVSCLNTCILDDWRWHSRYNMT